MGSKLFLGITSLLFLAALAQAKTLDVRMYGAKADQRTDDGKAIFHAWKDACHSKDHTTILIPQGQYKVGPLTFSGPCNAPSISFNVQGTLLAPIHLNRFKIQDGWFNFQYLNNLEVYGGGVFDGQGAAAWSINNCAKVGKCNSLPINIKMHMLNNSAFRDITSRNSKLFHMNVQSVHNLTMERITIEAPPESLNTDGIHIGRSKGVYITGAKIHTGDDCVSLGDGSQEITIENTTCTSGHGFSVGSLGKYQNEEPVKGVYVRNCTLSNTDNGIRIKTWPGSTSGIASDIHFEDILMNNVACPIDINQIYCPYNQCLNKIPSRVRIYNVSFKNIRGSSSTQTAVKLICSGSVPCQNVELSDISLKYNGTGTVVSECSHVKPKLSGTIVPLACTKISN